MLWMRLRHWLAASSAPGSNSLSTLNDAPTTETCICTLHHQRPSSNCDRCTRPWRASSEIVVSRSAMAYASRRPVEFGLLAIAETIQRWLVRVRLHLVATAVVASSTTDDQQYRHASSVEQLMPLRIGLRQRHDSLDAILHRDAFHRRHDGRAVVAGDDLDGLVDRALHALLHAVDHVLLLVLGHLLPDIRRRLELVDQALHQVAGHGLGGDGCRFLGLVVVLAFVVLGHGYLLLRVGNEHAVLRAEPLHEIDVLGELLLAQHGALAIGVRGRGADRNLGDALPRHALVLPAEVASAQVLADVVALVAR